MSIKSHHALLPRPLKYLTLLAVSLAVLPNVPRLPSMLMAVVGGGLLLALFSAWRGLTLPGWLRALLAISSAGLVFYAYDFSIGRDTGSALLLVMLSLKMLELRTLRDARSGLSFSLFVLMAAFLNNQAFWVFGTTLLAGFGIFYALAQLSSHQTPDQHRPPTSVTWWRSPTIQLIGKLALLSLPLALVLFLFFPRLASPLWGLPENAMEQTTGLGDQMSPGRLSELLTDDRTAMRALFNNITPTQDEMYWRGPVLNHFDGRTWTRDLIHPERNIKLNDTKPPNANFLGEAITYQLTIEPNQARYIPALDIPNSSPEKTTQRHAFNLENHRPISELTRFDLSSHSRYILAPNLSPAMQQAYQQLPEGFNPRTRAWVQEKMANGIRGEAMIRELLNYFQQTFTYTLTPGQLGKHSVDEVMFDTHKGYCEHFSSNFVVALRMAGIPARVVTGYQGGYFNPYGNHWVVRNSDAHAWAEVWLQGKGWVRIDPTSVVEDEMGLGREQHSSEGMWKNMPKWLKELRGRSDWLQYAWNEMVLGFNAARQRGLLQNMGILEPDTKTITSIMIGLVIVAILPLFLYLLWSFRKPSQPPLVKAWQHFIKRLEKHLGYPIDDPKTPKKIIKLKDEVNAEQQDKFTQLCHAFEQLRYAPDSSNEHDQIIKRLHELRFQ